MHNYYYYPFVDSSILNPHLISYRGVLISTKSNN